MSAVTAEQAMTRAMEEVLDALDDAPDGIMQGESPFIGPLATIQWLSSATGKSDTTTRRTVLGLLERGLVRMWEGTDPFIGRRRLYVTGEAA